MPLYEYVCQDCGEHFDALRSFKEADQPIRCKSCFSERTIRAISVFYASSDGRAIATSGGGCSGCGGGSCSSCGGHH
ncbi:FmdB family zinc ribbon protein [Anaerolinea thermolimosa]|uniref:FmdB family zinc ribbon protein n=1 Tax=Anaerolinea thermolimosa TaxID=229919 RepID=UPI000A03F8ED